jgi:hypothetical protein
VTGQPAPQSQELCSAWATPDDVPETYRGNVSDAQWIMWLMFASETMFRLSGQQWSGGGCTYTAELRGAPPEPGSGAWPYYRTWGLSPSGPAYWWWNSFLGFAWFPQFAGPVSSVYAIKLPHDEITEVTAVLINGEPFSSWQLVRGSWLERTDGDRWGKSTDTTLVTYGYGVAAPAGGVNAVVQLAVEIMKWQTQDNSCRLPKRVTSITRQGVSLAVIDPMRFLDKGRTGVYEIDLWLAAVNPQGRQRRGRVWSPDIPLAR